MAAAGAGDGAAPKPKVTFAFTAPPMTAVLTAEHVGTAVDFAGSTSAKSSAARLDLDSGASLHGDMAIARFLARSAGKTELLGGSDAFAASEVDQWVDFATALGIVGGTAPYVATLNDNLSSRTWLAGFQPSLADIAVVSALFTSGADVSGAAHVQRWLALCDVQLPVRKAKGTMQSFARAAASGGGDASSKGGKGGKKGGAAGGKKGAGESKKGSDAKKGKGKGTGKDGGAAAGAGGGKYGNFDPLEDAEEGKVVTRFPPEPSGFLHIGHAKALFLNNYYARAYKGTLVVRFDDTNPSKEKEEYELSMLDDLERLGVHPDKISHTSDYFDVIVDYARQIIRDGGAYMDDTEQAKMQQERMDGIESVNRNKSVEDNLKAFNGMLAGDADYDKFCMRAKINMTADNKTLRDPVLFRGNKVPHARTGTAYKAYPTYDFACPIVDSVEGITHAMRTTEYDQRREQYYWLQDFLKLRRVKMFEFGRMNFIYTVMSKRKLAWFVDNKRVRGWDDPRFPTIQGMINSGMQVEVLRDFMESQGNSRRVIDMEWDKFWSNNARFIDNDARRATAIDAAAPVPLTLVGEGAPASPVGLVLSAHPKNADLGNRVVTLCKDLLLEASDVQVDTMVEGAEIVLMHWDLVVLTKVTRDKAGLVTAMEAKLFGAGATKKQFQKSPKVSWVANTDDKVPATLCEFGYLVDKPKMSPDDNFDDHIVDNTEETTAALGDGTLRNVQRGQIIQLERRGYFRCDQPYGGAPNKPIVLFMIPDGKKAAMSSVASKLAHR